MVKFTVIFHKPADIEEFEFVYSAFLALVERMPLITRRQVNTVLGSPLGDIAYYRVLEVYYDSYERLDESLRSPAGQEAGGELRRLPRGTVQMYFADVFEEAGGSTPA